MSGLSFSPKEVRSILDLKQHTYNNWINIGFLHPSEPSNRQGHSRAFDSDGLVRGIIGIRLVNAGMSISTAKYITHTIYETDEFDTVISDEDEELVRVSLEDGIYITINITSAFQEVEKRVTELRAEKVI